MSEIWRPVVGFCDSYEVSNLGRVRSLDRIINIHRYGREETRRRSGQSLTPRRNPIHGHASVQFGSKNYGVHRLVLEAFVGPCPPGMECRHANDVPDDNTLSNLSWGTRSQNRFDGMRNGRRWFGERHGSAKLTDKDIHVIRALPSTYLQREIALWYGVSRSEIGFIRSGKRWKQHSSMRYLDLKG